MTKQPKEIRGLEMPPAANNFVSRNLGFTLQAEPTVAYGGKSVQVPSNASAAKPIVSPSVGCG